MIIKSNTIIIFPRSLAVTLCLLMWSSFWKAKPFNFAAMAHEKYHPDYAPFQHVNAERIAHRAQFDPSLDQIRRRRTDYDETDNDLNSVFTNIVTGDVTGKVIENRKRLLATDSHIVEQRIADNSIVHVQNVIEVVGNYMDRKVKIRNHFSKSAEEIVNQGVKHNTTINCNPLKDDPVVNDLKMFFASHFNKMDLPFLLFLQEYAKTASPFVIAYSIEYHLCISVGVPTFLITYRLLKFAPNVGPFIDLVITDVKSRNPKALYKTLTSNTPLMFVIFSAAIGGGALVFGTTKLGLLSAAGATIAKVTLGQEAVDLSLKVVNTAGSAVGLYLTAWLTGLGKPMLKGLALGIEELIKSKFGR